MKFISAAQAIHDVRIGPNFEIPKVWLKIRKMAELTDVRIHDLRHSFTSVAVSERASLPIIGALLGHTDSATTQRYAPHLQNEPIRAASEATATKIAIMMGTKQE